MWSRFYSTQKRLDEVSGHSVEILRESNNFIDIWLKIVLNNEIGLLFA